MEINTFTNLITGVGFPIACCILLFLQNNNMQKTLTDVTLAMQSIVDRLERIENSVERFKERQENK